MNKGVPRWAWAVLILLVAASLGIVVYQKDEGRKGEKIKASSPEARVVAVAPEEFVLKVGEEVPTVEAGPGTYHRLWANKPYQAVSVQPDGRRILYNMPAGWESWVGDEPTGRLRLIGRESETVVKIYKRR